MGANGDGDVLLTSTVDRLITPFSGQTDDLVNDVSLFAEDFLLPSEADQVDGDDQLSLLMKDIDFNFDFLDQNIDSKRMLGEQGCVNNFSFPSAENCFAHSSPISSDSGNHSPSSTSSEGAQFAEVWNDCNAKHGDGVISDEFLATNQLSMDEQRGGSSSFISSSSSSSSSENNEMATDDLNSKVHCLKQPQYVPPQVSTQQSVIYIVPSTSSSSFNTQQNICFNSAPAEHLSDKSLISKRSPTCVNSNRMQPYTVNRPQLLIPKPDPEKLSKNSVTAKPLINTVSLAAPATIFTPVIPSCGGLTAETSVNKILMPVLCSSLVSNGPANMKLNEDAQEYARKREERKIKNRASAQQSRLRKRHELDELKQKLSESERTVEKLRAENEQLRKQITCLRSENDVLKKNVIGVRGRTGVVTGVACLLFFCAFAGFGQRPVTKLGTFIRTSEFIPPEDSDRSSAKDVLRGRPLLSVDYDNAEIEANGKRREKRFSDSIVDHSDSDTDEIRLLSRNISNDIDCGDGNKVVLNQTERIKVNNDLSNWVDRHERLLFLQMRRVFRAPVPKLSKSADDSLLTNSRFKVKSSKSERTGKSRRNSVTRKEERMLKVTRERAWRHIDLISSGGSAVAKSRDSRFGSVRGLFSGTHDQLKLGAIKEERGRFPNAETHYMELARAIKQKDDTLYVFALQDYYLLPTVNRNSTDRPRISLILPAFSYNGTIRNQVPMMRIECEVTGTGLFHMSDSLLLFFYNQSYSHQ